MTFTGPLLSLTTFGSGIPAMWPALQPSKKIAAMGAINPQSATTVQTTGWVDASTFENFLALIEVGVISSGGTVNATVQQASSATGTGAKQVYSGNNTSGTALSITALTQAGGSGNQQVLINIKNDDLDASNGFRWLQLSITPSGAAALIAGQLLGVDARYGPADTLAPAAQVQIVGP